LKTVGWDAGMGGAYALYDSLTGDVSVFDNPLTSDGYLDVPAAFATLLDWEPQRLVVEDCWRPKSLVRQVGSIIAVGQLLQAEVMVTAVVTWKTKVLGYNTSEKAVSISCVHRLLPQAVPLLRKPRARTDSADRAEAVLMAWYAANRDRRPSPTTSANS
jgi:hypothetical protein